MPRPPNNGPPTQNRTRSDVIIMEAMELMKTARRRLSDRDYVAALSRIAWEAMEREIDHSPMELDDDAFDAAFAPIRAAIAERSARMHRRHAVEFLLYLAQDCLDARKKLLQEIEQMRKPQG